MFTPAEERIHTPSSLSAQICLLLQQGEPGEAELMLPLKHHLVQLHGYTRSRSQAHPVQVTGTPGPAHRDTWSRSQAHLARSRAHLVRSRSTTWSCSQALVLLQAHRHHGFSALLAGTLFLSHAEAVTVNIASVLCELFIGASSGTHLKGIARQSSGHTAPPHFPPEASGVCGPQPGRPEPHAAASRSPARPPVLPAPALVHMRTSC